MNIAVAFTVHSFLRWLLQHTWVAGVVAAVIGVMIGILILKALRQTIARRSAPLDSPPNHQV